MENKKKKKGYALLITIVIVTFLSIVVMTSFTIVNRYNILLEESKLELRESVK